MKSWTVMAFLPWLVISGVIGGLFTGDTTFGVGTVAAVIVLGVLIYLIVRPYKESEEMEVKYTGK